MMRSLDAYMGLLVLAEITLSVSFLVRQNIAGVAGYHTDAGRRGLASAGAGFLLLCGLWVTVRRIGSPLFTQLSFDKEAQAAAMLALSLGILVLIGLACNRHAYRNLRVALRRPVRVLSVSVPTL